MTMVASPRSRRTFLRSAGVLTGGAVLWRFAPDGPHAYPLQAPAVQVDPLVEKLRAQMGAAAIETTKLGDRLMMLSGPGGNVVVLSGPGGKFVVDSFLQPAWPRLKAILDGIDNSPITLLIDTHWHIDHSDNNANFRAAGARVLAHENTRKRLMEPHDLLGMHFEPSPPEGLPGEIFADRRSVTGGGEQMVLAYVPPAHTDTDILVHFTRGNVLHMGDLFFNGSYPFIDASTGGNMNGMIASADTALQLVNAQTKVIPGHGPLGDKASLGQYRDMMVTVRDRVQKLKTSGQTLEQVVAAKPTKDLDDPWGKGFMQPDFFVTIVYGTL